MSSNKYCDRDSCDLSHSGKFCEMLDKAGVPADYKWRTLILYMRGLKDYSHLSDKQKEQVQQLLVDILQKRDFSDDNYHEILKRDKAILVAPYEEQLKAALTETAVLAGQFKSLMQRRTGDVKALETQSVEAVTSGKNTEEIVAMLQGTFRDVIQIMENDINTLDQLSKTDPLTGLPNRRALDERLNSAIEEWEKSQTPIALLMLDIDHFKNFNDEFGHRIGDQALTTVGTIIRKCIKALPFGEDMVSPARFGGEEFSIVLTGAAVTTAEELAKLIRKQTESYNFVIRDGNGEILRKGINLTISIGVASANKAWSGAIKENLIDAADKALYYAKDAGRNRVAKYINDAEGWNFSTIAS